MLSGSIYTVPENHWKVANNEQRKTDRKERNVLAPLEHFLVLIS